MKTIVITGASSGIGAACARAAVEAGHRVALTARSKDRLDALARDLGDRAQAFRCDVTDYASQQRMFEAVADAFGPPQIVFANAGVGTSHRGTEEGSASDFEAMVLTNNLALTYTAKLAIPYLKRTVGHLLVTGSQAGVNVIPGSVYGATKWFVRGYARNLAAELDGTGVRVTNIEPGMVDTPFFDEAKPQALRPDDIARAFMFAIGQPPNVQVASMLVRPTPR